MKTIPVTASAKEALNLPFQHFEVFLRLGFWPMVITYISQFVGGFLAGFTGRSLFYALWWVPYSIIVAPFSISWTRLVFFGLDSNAERTWYTFGERELKYLLASLAMIALFFGPPAIIFYEAYSMGWAATPLIVACVVLLAEIVVSFRFVFILPAIAVDSYQGLKAAWKQTRSVVLRIVAVIFLSSLPINCGSSIVHQMEASAAHQPPLLIVLGTADVLLLFLSAAVVVGATAVTFRLRMEPVPPVMPQSSDLTEPISAK